MRLVPIGCPTACLVLLLLAPSLRAEDTPVSDRFPPHATAYLEAHGLAGKLDAMLASPFGERLRAHDAVQALLASDGGRKLALGEAFLRGATGLDIRGVFRALAAREIAVAAYGGPQHALLVARVDAEVAARLVAGAEMLSQRKREVVQPADDAHAALWRLGPAFVVLDGDLLAVSRDEALALHFRSRAQGGPGDFAAPRRLVGPDADLFGWVDIGAYAGPREAGRKPRDLGQALLLGAFAHVVPEAPWAAFGLRVAPAGDGWRLEARAFVPRPEQPREPVTDSFGGTLDALPFALPPRSLGVIRLRRDLAALWSNREALIDERGIPGLVQFETNFGNLTAGMSWVDEFLPNVGDEVVLVGSRRAYAADAPAPAVHLPQGALLWTVKDPAKLSARLQLAYQTLVFILNQQAAQMGSTPLLSSTIEYKGVRCHVARYMEPDDAEMEPRKALALRYNFTPSAAVVGRHLVIASTEEVLRDLIDGRDGRTPAPGGVNAGVWLEPREIRAILVENRESLVADRMLKHGEDRDAAAARIDLALDAGRFVRALSLEATESIGTLGLELDIVLAPPEEG